MVTDEREYITVDNIKRFENYLNDNHARIKPAVFQFCRFAQLNTRLEFPFYWLNEGVSSYLDVSDEFEQLPNIEVIKHWKYVHSSNNNGYDLFAYEWMIHKYSIPQQIIDLMKCSQIATICHLLAKAYVLDNEEAILPLIHSYVPSHVDELDKRDVHGKRPIDLLASYTSSAVKSLFEPV